MSAYVLPNIPPGIIHIQPHVTHIHMYRGGQNKPVPAKPTRSAPTRPAKTDTSNNSKIADPE